MPSKVDRKCRACPTLIARESKTGLCSPCYRAERKAQVPVERVKRDLEAARLKSDIEDLKKKYEGAKQIIERQNAELGWLEELRAGIPTTYKIEPKESSGTSEATPVLIASDWHSEEIVKPSQVAGLNVFNPEIEERRSVRFFQSGLNLIRNHINPGVKINEVVLALLGDFITGQIHGAENAESNAFTPVEAAIRVGQQLETGINFLLNHSKYNFVIPCKVGNHSRITQRVRFSNEEGHSLESMVYVNLAGLYKKEPRVKFVMDSGYHTYLDIYNRPFRLHHGHAIQYQGGIGGLFIPAYKAISQWNKGRKAVMDIFGHFHQTKDGGNFLCNGSLIGYNGYALSIKADYEPPSQTLLLVDKKRGRTCTWPIYVEPTQLG